jgi:hypothetical protein
MTLNSGLTETNTFPVSNSIVHTGHTAPVTHLKVAWIAHSPGVSPMPSRFVQLLPYERPRFVGEHAAPREVNRNGDQF